MKKVITFCITWFLRISGVAGLIVCISYYAAPSTRDTFNHPIENLILGILCLVGSGGSVFKKKKSN